MSYELNAKIRELSPYQPISGSYRIRLDANESFLSLPRELVERAALDVLNNQIDRKSVV